MRPTEVAKSSSHRRRSHHGAQADRHRFGKAGIPAAWHRQPRAGGLPPTGEVHIRTSPSSATTAASRRQMARATPTPTSRPRSAANPTHRSKTGPEARLARKNNGDASRLAHRAHTMIEHRSGLIVDVECTEFNGHVEVQAALAMLKRTASRAARSGRTSTMTPTGLCPECAQTEGDAACGA